MCGILGMVGTRWQTSAETALAALHLRGPDEQSFCRRGPALLAHTRLAVIDLAGGHQPMQTPDGRFTLVFNGEIYNAPALRQELEALGERFCTDHSDTEVLLLGFRAWGAALLDKLDGMFAFAVWDDQAKRLFAARDRLGIKPFMYATVEGGLIFASTLAPFLALPGFPRRLSLPALRDYLAFQTPLAPDTVLRDVKQLPPGHCLHFSEGDAIVSLHRWWRIPAPRAEREDHAERVARIDEALRTSVVRQMAADVPLGAFLSGGIDSSLMVRYLSEASARPLQTFCLKFAEDHFDESAHAAAVARHFGCEHHVLEAPSITADTFADAIRDLDQPLADPAYVMTHALSRLTRQFVTVAISGDGGDELFGGYPRFRETADRHPAAFWQPWLRRAIHAGLAPEALLRRTLAGRELLHYRRVELGPWPGRKDIRRYVRPEHHAALQAGQTLGAWQAIIDELGGEADSATLMRADWWTYLSENCLTKTDRASMAHSLEVRVPMLGQPVLDAVSHMPADAHLTADGNKALLLALARQHLPETVWNREKHGFSVPLRSQFAAAWRATADEYFARTAQLAPFLEAGAVQRLWRDTQSGRASRRLAYTLLVLLIWLERHPLDA